MEKNIIAAVSDNLAIGRDNQLLWHISADMKYFRRTTTGYPVIMGYKTWLSIGRPLPGRKNIVITKHPFEAPDSVIQVPDVEGAFVEAEKGMPLQNPSADNAGVTAEGALHSPEKCFIIGGAKTYERTLDRADKLYITHVNTEIADADAFFPAIDTAQWEKVSETEPETDSECGLTYSFAVYVRRK